MYVHARATENAQPQHNIKAAENMEPTRAVLRQQGTGFTQAECLSVKEVPISTIGQPEETISHRNLRPDTDTRRLPQAHMARTSTVR